MESVEAMLRSNGAAYPGWCDKLVDALDPAIDTVSLAMSGPALPPIRLPVDCQLKVPATKSCHASDLRLRSRFQRRGRPKQWHCHGGVESLLNISMGCSRGGVMVVVTAETKGSVEALKASKLVCKLLGWLRAEGGGA